MICYIFKSALLFHSCVVWVSKTSIVVTTTLLHGQTTPAVLKLVEAKYRKKQNKTETKQK